MQGVTTEYTRHTYRVLRLNVLHILTGCYDKILCTYIQGVTTKYSAHTYRVLRQDAPCIIRVYIKMFVTGKIVHCTFKNRICLWKGTNSSCNSPFNLSLSFHNISDFTENWVTYMSRPDIFCVLTFWKCGVDNSNQINSTASYVMSFQIHTSIIKYACHLRNSMWWFVTFDPLQ